MIIYSELTKEKYNSVKECEEAEKKFKLQQDEAEQNKKKLSEQKKARADEVNAAYRKIRDAEKEYYDLMNRFIEDYGYFHASYYDQRPPLLDIFTFFRDF